MSGRGTSSPRGGGREYGLSRDGDRSGHGRDRERDRPDRSGRSRSRSPRRDHDRDGARGPRDYDRWDDRGGRGGDYRRGGGRGGESRGGGPRGGGPRDYRNDGARYDGGGPYGRREEDRYERDRPLDRRAIEEGRRRREEERASGVVFTDEDAKKGGYDPGEEGSASPYPGQGRRYEEMGDGQGNAEGGEEEDAMAAMMGFGGFGTTKGKGIGTNADGAVKVHKERTWRQYMNRRGGFNRPLEKMK